MPKLEVLAQRPSQPAHTSPSPPTQHSDTSGSATRAARALGRYWAERGLRTLQHLVSLCTLPRHGCGAGHRDQMPHTGGNHVFTTSSRNEMASSAPVVNLSSHYEDATYRQKADLHIPLLCTKSTNTMATQRNASDLFILPHVSVV